MKLTVLVDNNSLIDRYLIAEPGLSILIEDSDKRVLFDTGYSDVFIQNANKLRLDLFNLDYVVFSHGHLDHTWGLDPLIKLYTGAAFEGMTFKRPTVVAHERLFESVGFGDIGEFSSIISQDKLAKHFPLRLTREPLWLSSRLVYLGEIERANTFESQIAFGKKEGETNDDYVIDDSALVYKAHDGLVIITGCSHSGICNIIEKAKQVCGVQRIVDVVGGLHLMNPTSHVMDNTLAYFSALKLPQLHACHCTDLHSKIALSRVAPLCEVGSGTSMEYR